MKKLLLTLTAVSAIAFASHAQTEQGRTIVGGQLGLNTSSVKDSDDKSTNFSIAPEVGYFVSDNFALGLGVGYSWAKQESTDSEHTLGAFTVAPFGRYYKGEGNVKFFGQLSVPMAWGTLKSDGDKTGTTANYGVELAPGIAYFPTNKLAIEFKVRGLYYNNGSVKDEIDGGKVTTNSFGLNADSFAPSVGVKFHF